MADLPVLAGDVLDGGPDLPDGGAEEVEVALQVALLTGSAFRAGDGAKPLLESFDLALDIHPPTIRT